jgi:nucleotide-binding universal stress UspA family protein
MLICYDGSGEAARAIAVAADLFVGRKAVVLEVTPPLSAEEHEAAFLSVGAAHNIDDRIRDVRSLARRGARLARARGLEAVERVDVAVEVWEGVVEVADDIDASVIVLGSRGVTGARERFEGSVSHDLARHSGRPVLVVPPESPPAG